MSKQREIKEMCGDANSTGKQRETVKDDMENVEGQNTLQREGQHVSAREREKGRIFIYIYPYGILDSSPE